MSPLTYYLSFSSLSPIQIQFSHGHPLTSASSKIDYYITSDKFRTEIFYELNGNDFISINDDMSNDELSIAAVGIAEYQGRYIEDVYEYKR